MKVLIISPHPWRDDNNTGNVLSNIFKDVEFEFAQIYFNEGIPNNDRCNRYCRITERSIFKSLLNKRNEPVEIIEGFFFSQEKNKNKDKQSFTFIKSFLKEYLYNISVLAKEFILSNFSYENIKLNDFISTFEPDIIYAPSYGSIFFQKMTRYLHKRYKLPIVSYISDDHYSLKQLNLSIFFYINRFLLRREIRKTFPLYSLIYTMTDEQKCEYENELHCNIKILRKSVKINDFSAHSCGTKPIKIIYAGNIYAGRVETLIKLSYAIKNINKKFNTQLFELNIYTGANLKSKVRKVLDDKVNTNLHSIVTLDKLKLIYKNSDIALHVESFKIKYRLLTRLSFSTKIVDCLASTSAVMAICWEENAGYKYLKKNNAAFCISNINSIENELLNIIENTEKIKFYKQQAYSLLKTNHDSQYNKIMIENDFRTLVKKNNENSLYKCSE